MISNKTLKDTLDGIKKISKVDLFVYDLNGKIVANTTDADDKISDAVFDRCGICALRFGDGSGFHSGSRQDPGVPERQT